MAGPIYLKLSGIDKGHSVNVLGKKNYLSDQEQVGVQQGSVV